MTTLINIDLLIAKLQMTIDDARGATFVTTKAALLEMAVRAIEQQERELTMYRNTQAAMNEAIVAAFGEVER